VKVERFTKCFKKLFPLILSKPLSNKQDLNKLRNDATAAQHQRMPKLNSLSTKKHFVTIPSFSILIFPQQWLLASSRRPPAIKVLLSHTTRRPVVTSVYSVIAPGRSSSLHLLPVTLGACLLSCLREANCCCGACSASS
jgi:hypothetical protein